MVCQLLFYIRFRNKYVVNNQWYGDNLGDIKGFWYSNSAIAGERPQYKIAIGGHVNVLSDYKKT